VVLKRLLADLKRLVEKSGRELAEMACLVEQVILSNAFVTVTNARVARVSSARACVACATKFIIISGSVELPVL
jgi:hypothetical protein